MRKKLFAILMSAMMMVTFMPAMAFAAEDVVVWNDDYTAVTVNGYDQEVTQYVVLGNGGTTWDGLVVASCNAAKVGFYNLNSSKVNNEVLTYQEMQSLVTDKTKKVDLTLSIPASVKKYKMSADGASYDFGRKYEPADSLRYSSDYTHEINDGAVVTAPNYDESKKYEIQKFDVTAGFNYAGYTAATVVGTIPASKLQVEPAAFDVQHPETLFSVDGKVWTGTANYDGAEHTIVLKDIPGVTATFEKKNAKNAWEAVDAMTYKDVNTYKFRATVKKNGVYQGYAYLDMTVSAAAATIAFDTNDAPVVDGAERATTFKVAEGYNVKDYIVVAGTKVQEGATQTEDEAAKTAANKKAAAADKALIMEYFDDFYTVVQTPKKYDATQVKATFAKKDLTALTVAEKDALIEKYGTLLKNFGFTATRADITTPHFVTEASYANFIVTEGGDIEWVKAPLTKTFKYKNLKKKAKTFTVKAVADSTVTYAVENGGSQIKIDKKTGKVTVKKGLKKGTYKVTVWAKAGKSQNYFDLKIKVK